MKNNVIEVNIIKNHNLNFSFGFKFYFPPIFFIKLF
jgi:hypothetical protein